MNSDFKTTDDSLKTQKSIQNESQFGDRFPIFLLFSRIFDNKQTFHTFKTFLV